VAEHDDPRLEAALRDLAQRLKVPAPPDVTASVRARLVASPARAYRARWLPRLAIAAGAALFAVAVAATASPEVRAAIVNLLRFAGVEVRQEPGPTPTGHGVLPGERTISLAEARQLAAFPVYVPTAFGPPEEVRISDGQPPRVVSLVYRPGSGRPQPATDGIAVRLDEFDGQIAPVFEKFASGPGIERVRVANGDGVWVPGPHEVVYVDRSGQWRTESARLAANTLIWQLDRVTLRLEGRFTKAEALTVASSVR